MSALWPTYRGIPLITSELVDNGTTRPTLEAVAGPYNRATDMADERAERSYGFGVNLASDVRISLQTSAAAMSVTDT
jgi:hypothetical protein